MKHVTITSDFTDQQESHFLKLIHSNQVLVLKVKKDVATVIKYNNNQYTVQHPSHMRGNQNVNRRG